MIFQDLQLSLRHLKKDKFTTIINVLGLTIGITGCLVIYLIILAQLSYDNFHPAKDRIYRIVSHVEAPGGDSQTWSTIPYPAAGVFRQATGVEALAVFISFYAKVSIPFEDQQLIVAQRPDMEEEVSDIVMVEPDYFDIFEFEWLSGNKDSALIEPFTVVLTQSKARSYFGEVRPSEVIGKEVIYNDSLRTVVTGVVDDWEQNTDLVFRDFISFATVGKSQLRARASLENWNVPNRFSQTFVRLEPTADADSLEKKLTDILNANAHKNHRIAPFLQPLSALHFDEVYDDVYSEKAQLQALYMMLTIAFFILALAIINFINLATAQSSYRAKEMALKKILGAGKWRLIGQFLLETGILTLAALTLSLLLANPVLSVISNFIPKNVGLYLIDTETIYFILIITAVTTLLAGWYPATVLASSPAIVSRQNPVYHSKSLKGFFRRGLIVFQFTISVVFIISALAVASQLKYMLSKDMGFDRKYVMSFNIPGQNFSSSYDSVASKIKELPGVKNVSLNMGPPVERGHRTMSLIDLENAVTIEAELHSGDENYLPLFDIPLLAGRNYALSPSDSLTEFVINVSAAKMLGYNTPDEALGAQLTIQLGRQRKGTVVGVVGDFHSRPLQQPIQPAFFLHSANVSRTISLKMDPEMSQGEFSAAVQSIESIWQAYYPNEIFQYTLLEQAVVSLYKGEFRTMEVMTGAMAISLFIACLGLYGLVTFITEQRAKEIGIRKVLGASVPSIVLMLCKEFVVLIAISVAIGSPIGFSAMNGWLNYFAYSVELDFWIFLMAAAIVFFISLATISFHAIRVAQANPVKSLRTE